MKLIDIFFAVLVAALWGGNFVAAKYGVEYFPPFFFTALRFAIVAAVLIPFVPRPSANQIKRILPVSTMATFHFSLLFVALAQGLDIACGTLIGQIGVPFSCLLGAVFLKDKLGPWRIFGIIVSFIGLAVVAGAPNILTHMNAFYLALFSTCSWGITNIFVKRVSDVNSQALLAWMSLFTVPLLLVLSYIFEPSGFALLMHPRASALIGLTYTVLLSTIVAYGLWYYLLAKYTVSQVAPISLLTPIFGITAGQLFFHEPLTANIWWGGAITIAGVAIIVIRRPKLAIIAEAT